jgi:large conductance mechanosensitive channel
MLKEFKEFALKGNVVDMGVGIIIGAAFGKIVSSFVADILTPPLGLLLGKVNFSNLFISLSGKQYQSLAEAKAAGAATLNYGLFINSLIDFTLVAMALFILIRWVNKLRKPAPATVAVVPASKECPECLSSVPAKAKRCAHCASPLAV